MPEFDLEDKDNVAFMAQACQAEVVAYFARSNAKGKGKPMGKHAHGYKPPTLKIARGYVLYEAYMYLIKSCICLARRYILLLSICK